MAAWGEGAWHFYRPLQVATYREGAAVPFLLRIDRARPGTDYTLTIRYDCQAFDFLTAYNRDQGSGPALASGGPESATADSTLSIPNDPGTAADDGEAGAFSMWGGSFSGVGGLLPSAACASEKSLEVSLLAAANTVFLMWAAQLSEAASDADVSLRLAVRGPGSHATVTLAIGPTEVEDEGKSCTERIWCRRGRPSTELREPWGGWGRIWPQDQVVLWP